MELLNIKLYSLFSKELLKYNIGYIPDNIIIKKMLNLINAIDYIRYGNPTKKEIKKILKYYE